MSSSLTPRAGLATLRWPLPAIGAWLAAWFVYAAGRPQLGAGAAALAAVVLGGLLAWRQALRWRRAWVALGFPLSALVTALASGWPAWAWLLPLALLAIAYPLRAWRDAPWFPSPAGVLDGLVARLALPAGAQVLDAGCGGGDGLRALRSAWPQAQVHGVEWSWPLVWLSRARCPWARVQRGDMWAASWAGLDLVYLFQRPESMARAWSKAAAEMAPGGWLVSLEFEVPGRAPELSLDLPCGRPLQAWRVGAQSVRSGADNPL